jgi:mRNA interferase RelE/StbE
MASFNIVFKISAEKDLRSLPQSAIGRVLKQIELLASEPFPRRSLKLTGAESLYRIRVGDYRIVYGVDRDAGQIIVHYVRHRRDVYRQL